MNPEFQSAVTSSILYLLRQFFVSSMWGILPSFNPNEYFEDQNLSYRVIYENLENKDFFQLRFSKNLFSLKILYFFL